MEVSDSDPVPQDNEDDVTESENQMLLEDTSDTFSYEDDSHSDSQNSHTSTDISSSIDEFAEQHSEIKFDKNVEDKIKEKLSREILQVDKKSKDRGVVYLGHLPYGFFEKQLREFFSQFGDVTRLRVSRNKKTGRSKSFCFIEFEDPIVARIVADTMDGYIMFQRSLKCQVIPPEKVHPKMFNGANKIYYPNRTINAHRIAHNAPKNQKDVEKNIKNLLKKEEKKRKKLQELGINYDFPGYKSIVLQSEKVNS